MTYEYKLKRALTYADIEFAYKSGVPFRIDDPSLLGPDDSGWCDASSGHRLLTPSMRIYFHLDNPEDKTLIYAKYFGEIQVVF